MQKLRLESIDVEITSRCNLACSYCYASINKTDLKRGDMSDETVNLILDAIEKFGYPRPFKDDKGKQHQSTKITFYGGEPLIAFDRVKCFVDKSRERKMQLTFSALSNGTIGTPEMVKWFKENNIWVQRSIDGCPECQEKYRPNSIKPYEEKTKLWKDYESSRRMTIQPDCAKDLMKSMHYFESQGFWKGNSPMPNFYTEWTEQEMQDMEKSLWEMGDYYLKMWQLGKPFYNYYYSREMVARFLEPHKSHWGCGGGRGLHCVTWDGQLLLCHRFSRELPDSQFYFGTLKEVLNETAKGYGEEVLKHDAMYERGKREDWRPECKNCIAQYSCEKECMHVFSKTTGDMSKPPELYCRIRRTVARKVTLIDSVLRCKDPDWWTRGNTLPVIKDYVARKNTPEYLTARLGEAVLKVDRLKEQLKGGNRNVNLQKRNCDKGKC